MILECCCVTSLVGLFTSARLVIAQLYSYSKVVAVTCRTNEVYVKCTQPEKTCANPYPISCPLICGKPACRCRTGFARNSRGTCVPLQLCPKPLPKPSTRMFCQISDGFMRLPSFSTLSEERTLSSVLHARGNLHQHKAADETDRCTEVYLPAGICALQSCLHPHFSVPSPDY